ncbi:MAG: hypothetical protein JWO25_898, partial [Alphaproteobacteria bacterium]|nr:hypothetical protein [Alphaproteobacteria bacterium]
EVYVLFYALWGARPTHAFDAFGSLSEGQAAPVPPLADIRD